tara:strand:- start:784 stop:999 length:216 start_codon:yes stop_codon:yes gene_type:complete
MKFSNQAIGALLITLQKCLAEEKDITELLGDWNLTVKDNELYVENPPTFSFGQPDETTPTENAPKFVFETE